MNINETYIKELLSENIPFNITAITNISNLPKQPFRMDGGAIMICTDGEAEIAIDANCYSLTKGCVAIVLDEMSLFIIGTTGNFRLTIFFYSKEMAFQATYKFGPAFFSQIVKNPISQHDKEELEALLAYTRILQGIYAKPDNRYCIIMATNILRNILLDTYDKLQKHGISECHSRKEEIYNRFIELLIRHGRKHRDVAYYADKLCVSTKYLSEIAKAVAKETPKQAIDNYIVSEIKVMLTFSDMSIQQIANYLHFPDQSYLGRYFKHHTGKTPSEYKRQDLVY